jgi:hypothetical protein
MSLTINELKPGHLYTVVDQGEQRSPRQLLAIVLAVDRALPYRAVTIKVAEPAARAPGAGVGVKWGAFQDAPQGAAEGPTGPVQRNLDARFVPHGGAVVLTNPAN